MFVPPASPALAPLGYLLLALNVFSLSINTAAAAILVAGLGIRRQLGLRPCWLMRFAAVMVGLGYLFAGGNIIWNVLTNLR